MWATAKSGIKCYLIKSDLMITYLFMTDHNLTNDHISTSTWMMSMRKRSCLVASVTGIPYYISNQCYNAWGPLWPINNQCNNVAHSDLLAINVTIWLTLIHHGPGSFGRTSNELLTPKATHTKRWWWFTIRREGTVSQKKLLLFWILFKWGVGEDCHAQIFGTFS